MKLKNKPHENSPENDNTTFKAEAIETILVSISFIFSVADNTTFKAEAIETTANA